MSIPNCKKPVESSKQVFYWDGKSNTDNTENIKLWQDIIDAAKLNESVTVIGVGSYGSYVFNVNKKKVEENSNLLSLGSISTSFYQREQAGGVTTDVITHGHVDIRFTDNKVSSNGGITESEYLANSYIPTNIRMPEGEITPYMPDKDWQPTTKKYVDDQVAGINVEILNSNIVNGSVEGSLRTINSAAEDDTYTMGVSAFSIGNATKASGAGAFSSGNNTVASGNMSSAMGNFTEASEKYTHAEGIYTTATGEASHAEGYGRKFANQEVQRSTITASGKGSHAEGYTGMPNCFITASGMGSHAEGYTKNKEIIASGKGSHAENGVASGNNSHAEGGNCTASGNQSHAEGNDTTASGHNSHSEGWFTIASGENQHVQGKWNIEDTNNKYAHIVGNGNSTINTTTRSNAHTIDWNGNAWFSGNVKVGGTGQDDTNAKELATKDFVNETISSNTSEFNSQYFVRDILLYADSQISDGKNLTTNYGITSEIFDKIKPGFVMYSEVGSNQKYYITPASVRWYRLIANSWYECIQVFYVYNGEFKSFNICKGEQAVWYGTDLSTYEPGAGGVACFTGDTLVYTDKGMKEISKIKKNDKVYSLNINNELELKPVDKLINHDVIGYYDVITDTDTFKASYSHPIYVEGKGAVKVINLQYGDMLKDCNGNLHMVKEVNAIEANTTVYEIRVKDNHNYFVGNDRIFVYNEESILD